MTDTPHRSTPGARIRLERGWSGEHLIVAGAHIANIFAFRDGQWSFHDAGFASGVIRCEPAGDARRELAILDALKPWGDRP